MAISTSALSNVNSAYIHNSVITVQNTNVDPDHNERTPLDRLRDHCMLSALVDSNERFDPPRCAEETRQVVLQTLADWINSNTESAEIMWLHGGAGAGKSAVVQTLAERLQMRRKLAASFFFSRLGNGRNDGNALIPTLVFQLVHTFPAVKKYVERNIAGDLGLFNKSRQTQLEKLFIEPLRKVPVASRVTFRAHFIVIDGLDECKGPDVQCDLLKMIAYAVPRLPFPFRILIASRRESHIVQTFDHDRVLKAITVHKFDLSQDPDADADIQRYVEDEFQEIHRIHRLRSHLPSIWPTMGDIMTIIERSSGHFIYAATVMRYIQSPRHRPDDRLQVILGLLPPPGNDRPYAQLDTLYSHIFLGVPETDIKSNHLVLGVMRLIAEGQGLFQNGRWELASDIETLLDMKPGGLELLLDPLASVVVVPEVITHPLHVFHKTLFDYLLDPSRSGPFSLDLTPAHETVTRYILRLVAEERDPTDFPLPLRSFAEHLMFHSRHAGLSDTLRLSICSLQTLRYRFIGPKCLEYQDAARVLRNYLYLSSRLRAKNFFKSVLRSRRSLNENIDHDIIKTNLGTLLRNWSPWQNSSTEIDVQPLQRAQKEHKDFSDLFKNLRAMQHNTILFSSLIRSGGQIIHSCHSLMLRDQGCCIGLFTYIHKLGRDFSFSTVDFILGSLSIQNWSGWILQQGTKHLQKFDMARV